MAAQPAVGDLIGHRYRLLRRIGAGGTGSVWEAAAEQAAADEAVAGGATDGEPARVAIKLLHPLGDPKLRTRFEHEARTGARLESPHIVRTLEYGVDEGTPYLVLELLIGEDLGARLKRVSRMSFEELCPIATQIAAGLGVAHEAGVVHRDLKPPNVFISEREGAEALIKILDFGIARSDDSAFSGITTVGKTLGSPYYMSPEQAAGRPVDTRSDLWSFGVVLYRALTGRRPFEGAELASVMVAIAKERPARASSLAPGLPAGIDDFFARALRKDAQDRFTTAAEMSQAFLALAPSALKELKEATPAAAAPPPAPVPTRLAAISQKPPDNARASPAARDDGDGPAWKPLLHRGLVALVLLLCAGSYVYAQRDAIRRALAPDEPHHGAAPHHHPTLPAPGTIPRVELEGPGGKLSLPLERAFIMNIWLQECADCMPSFEAWQRLVQRAGALPDARVVNVAYMRVTPEWAERYGVGDGLVVDPGHQIVAPLGVTQFTTFVVAPDGTILFRGNPTAESFEQQLGEAVARGSSSPP